MMHPARRYNQTALTDFEYEPPTASASLLSRGSLTIWLSRHGDDISCRIDGFTGRDLHVRYAGNNNPSVYQDALDGWTRLRCDRAEEIMIQAQGRGVQDAVATFTALIIDCFDGEN